MTTDIAQRTALHPTVHDSRIEWVARTPLIAVILAVAALATPWKADAQSSASRDAVVDGLRRYNHVSSIDFLATCERHFQSGIKPAFERCRDTYFCGARGASPDLDLACDYLNGLDRTAPPAIAEYQQLDPHYLVRAIAQMGDCRAMTRPQSTDPMSAEQAEECAQHLRHACDVFIEEGSVRNAPGRVAPVFRWFWAYSRPIQQYPSAAITLQGCAAQVLPAEEAIRRTEAMVRPWAQDGNVRALADCYDRCRLNDPLRELLRTLGAPAGTEIFLRERVEHHKQEIAALASPSDQDLQRALAEIDRVKHYIETHRAYLGERFEPLQQVAHEPEQLLASRFGAGVREAMRADISAITASLADASAPGIPAEQAYESFTQIANRCVRTTERFSPLGRLFPGERSELTGEVMRLWSQATDGANQAYARAEAERDVRETKERICGLRAQQVALHDVQRRQREIDRRTGTRDVQRERQLAEAIVMSEQQVSAAVAHLRELQVDFHPQRECTQ